MSSPASGVFRFHPRKIVNTGEDGWSRPTAPTARHAADTVVFETYEEVGFNFRMTDVQAAIGVAQMEELPRILAGRAAVAKRYDTAFARRDDLRVLRLLDGTEQSFQSYVLLLERPAGITREGVVEGLRRRGVTTRRAFMCSHLEPAHSRHRRPVELPVSEHLSRDGLPLPLSPRMTDQDVDRVIRAVDDLLPPRLTAPATSYRAAGAARAGSSPSDSSRWL